ncbi:sulfite exporter TauE/SafE family protein, partial [Streptomyces antibioticus]|uniref:sulfite exporter TauE/SafE family protein n=1 Tax=Streptomyces antibioticus TaxID=1890 RepID=UPI003F4774BE
IHTIDKAKESPHTSVSTPTLFLRTRRPPMSTHGRHRRQRQMGKRDSGATTGVLGVGGGFLAVPALTAAVGLRIREAAGTSLLVITLNSLAALAVRAGPADGLDPAVLAPFAGAAVLGAWDGGRLAAKVSGAVLRRVFAGVLLTAAALMAVETVALAITS